MVELIKIIIVFASLSFYLDIFQQVARLVKKYL